MLLLLIRKSFISETLKFYASHLAELTFAKQREKFRFKKTDTPTEVVPAPKKEDSDSDFGDPDEPIEVPEVNEKPSVKEKPAIPEKPKVKPAIPEKPKVGSKKCKEAEEALERARLEEEEAANRIRALQDDTTEKAKKVKDNEKALAGSFERIRQLQEEIEVLKASLESKSKALDRLKKTDQLLMGDDDALEKVKSAVNTQVEKLMNLSNQWDKHRKPLIDNIREKKSRSLTVSIVANKVS